MVTRVERFWADEGGAVTSDWVVLSALVIVLSVSLVMSVKQSTIDLGPAIASEIENALLPASGTRPTTGSPSNPSGGVGGGSGN